MTVVRGALPQHWVVREISPDYGLDLHIETFVRVPEHEAVWDALGEHVFAQVKNVDGVKITEITPHHGLDSTPREFLDAEAAVDFESMQVVSYSLETDEIETIRQMGSAVPVLLLVVDKKTATTYYICLNDWITKVLPVVSPDWRDRGTVTVHIPHRNVLSSDGRGWNYLSILAKRPKYYGAFVEFQKYKEEMRWAAERVTLLGDMGYGPIPDLSLQVREYKQRFSLYYSELIDLDIWPTDERPGLEIYASFEERVESVKEALEGVPDDWADPESREDSYKRMGRAMFQAEAFLNSLIVAPRDYGLLTRNWNLPTQLGEHIRAMNGD